MFFDNSALPSLWQQLREASSLFQPGSAPVHKARSIKKRFFQFGVEEVDWSAQNSLLTEKNQVLLADVSLQPR